MTTMPATPAAPAPAPTGPEPAGGRPRAVLALARFETRELLLQIPVLASLLLYVATAAWQLYSGHEGWRTVPGREGMADYPALQDADRGTQGDCLLLGVALFVCANRAVLRSRRSGTDRHFDVLVVEPWRRTVAHALSVVPFAAFTALVVAVRFGRAALRPGAVGDGSLSELAAGPLAVLLFGVAGVLLARLVPSAWGAPLFVIALYVAVASLLVLTEGAHWAEWLFPTVSESGADPLPSDLLGRPAAWHALYLAGLTGTLLGAAVLRGGGRTPRIKALTALALAAMVTGIAGQSPAASPELDAARARVSLHPERYETCTTRGATVYCALPEWTGRTDDWAEAVERVRSLTGGDAAGRRLTVRQRVEARYGPENDPTYPPLSAPGEVTVLTRWGGTRVPEFAAGLASVLVAGDEKAGGEVCDGRMVTVMWLALGAAPDPTAALRSVRLDDGVTGSAYVLTPTDGLPMDAAQTTVVRELLARPRDSVTAAVRTHWTDLTAPGVSTSRVAELLDVSLPEGTGAGDPCDV